MTSNTKKKKCMLNKNILFNLLYNKCVCKVQIVNVKSSLVKYYFLALIFAINYNYFTKCMI